MERAKVVGFGLLVYTDLDPICCQCVRALIFIFESLFHCILHCILLGL